jgi:hypothetical protein
MMRVDPLSGLAGVLLAATALAQVPAASVQGSGSVQGSATMSTPTGAPAPTTNAPSTSAPKSGAGSAATGASSTPDGARAAFTQASDINATLTRPVDAGKAKPGDPVSATVTNDVKSGGTVVIPRGSKLTGHVAEAKPHGTGSGRTAEASGAADDASRLGIVFDRAVLRDGREVPVSTTLMAVAAATGDVAASSGGTDFPAGAPAVRDGGGLGGTLRGAVGGVGGLASGIGGSVGGSVNGASRVVTSSPGAVGGLGVDGALRGDSRGTFGLRDVQLGSDAAAGGSGMLTSSSRTVRLDSGSQLLLGAQVSRGDAGATGAATQSASSSTGQAKSGSTRGGSGEPAKSGQPKS